ncbi:hypothetical protein MA16_Dca027845 [Dendrobium catenatum]|uniref:Uncharacterized protein n=1 Tax=Dendrobium catenatum TaxID=906689 RepID=A0A2I0VEE2_9ASPA|nr:hypothetical protein MA16_Dca027845 [Dendrobium catenatum]
MSLPIPESPFNLVSSFSHYGPTYMNPVHEAFGVDCSDVSTHLSAWHTLPVEASYDDPIVPVKGLGWLINGLILPAQQVWWDTMKTRPEAGRFGVKLEGSGKRV